MLYSEYNYTIFRLSFCFLWFILVLDATWGLAYTRQVLYLQRYSSSLISTSLICNIHRYYKYLVISAKSHVFVWKCERYLNLILCDILKSALIELPFTLSILLVSKDTWTNLKGLWTSSMSSLSKQYENYGGRSLQMRKFSMVRRAQTYLTFMSGRLGQSHSVLRGRTMISNFQSTHIFNERQRHWNVTNSKIPFS